MSYAWVPTLILAFCAVATHIPKRGWLRENTMFSLKRIVDEYIDNRRSKAENQMKRFADKETISDAITEAALCLTEKRKRHPHQYRIPAESLAEANRRLQQKQVKIKKCKTFDDLHSVINAATHDLWMIGELTIYDVSTRIGAYLGLMPSKVYLHRGTREGAKALGFTGKEPTIEISQLPPEFAALKPHEIEDCLCIYKDDLKNRTHSNKACCGPKKKLARKRGRC